jgi:hypothetical protein
MKLNDPWNLLQNNMGLGEWYGYKDETSWQ